MKISLIYTSARPQQILSVLSTWRKRASDWRNIEVVVVTDEPFSRKFPNMVCHLNPGRKDCVTGWNLAAAHATGDMLVQVSDDLYPPQDWDATLSAITEDMADYSLQLPDERGFPNSVFHPVISRGVYDHFGYLYPPDFRSMFCDNWLFAAHAKAGFLRRIHEREFWNHQHRVTHNVAIDDVTIEHESPERYAHGKEVLMRELATLGIAIDMPGDQEIGRET